MAKVAQAARLYVRDNSRPGEIFDKQALAGAPQIIEVGTLTGAGLLPDGFPATNALGQDVTVYAANHPIDGNPLDETTVASAYVYLSDSDLSTPGLMQIVAEEANKNGMSVSAPIFHESGESASEDCDGDTNNDVVLWDSDCMDVSEFSLLTGEADFIPGALVVPAWRSVQHDTRAVMRFPQPENPGYATMLTNLEMGALQRNGAGNCTNEVTIWNGTAFETIDSVSTGLCNALPDISSGTIDLSNLESRDRRRDIRGLGEMEADRIIVAEQASGGNTDVHVSFPGAGNLNVFTTDDDGAIMSRNMPSTATREVISVAGQVNVSGTLSLVGNSPNATGVGADPYLARLNISDNITVDHNLTVSDGSGNLSLRAGAVNARIARPTTITNIGPSAVALIGSNNPARYLGASVMTAGSTTVNNSGADEGVVVDLLNAPGVNISAQETDIIGEANLQALSITGALPLGVSPAGGNFNTIVGEVVVPNGGQIINSGDISVGESLSVSRNGNFNSNLEVAECFGISGNCPLITEAPPDVSF